VFDPFFTTKPEGLGLGLSISRAIVVQHGGQLDAVNNPAGGCSFRVWLPAYAKEK
jgi:signal transduction histidine kinase